MALFTTANARQMVAKSLLSRKARRKHDLERLALVDQLLEQAAKPAVITPVPTTLPDIEFVSRRLARVREQIDRLSDMLDTEEDPQKLDRISAAIERMSKIEQQLAGRPGPGTLKPTQPSSKSPVIMQDATPTPVPQSQDPPLPRRLSDPPDF